MEQEVENSKRLFAELTQFIKETEQQGTSSGRDEPTPPPPSVKAGEYNDGGYQQEINGQQLYSAPVVRDDNKNLHYEHIKPYSEPRKSIVYSDECVTSLPDIEQMPRDLDVDQYLKDREKKTAQIPNQHVKLANAYRQRIFQRTFSKPIKDLDSNEEEILSLSVEGHGNNSSKYKMRTAGIVPPRAKSASYGKMLQKQDEMLKRAPTTASRTSPSIPTPHYVQTLGAKQPHRGKAFSPELDSHARKDKNAKRYIEKGKYE